VCAVAATGCVSPPCWIDAQSNAHIWSDRYDGDMADVFDLQDRITERVVGGALVHAGCAFFTSFPIRIMYSAE
jgi:hypothetical protein